MFFSKQSLTDNKQATPTARLLAQIRMLLDYTASRPDQRIRDIAIDNPYLDGPQATPAQPLTLGMAAILKKVEEIDEAIGRGSPIGREDVALLQLVKDALAERSGPATGATIGYTTLYLCDKPGTARAEYADMAYPSYYARSRRHRWVNKALLALAFLMSILAIWESAHVSLGKSLLQGRQELRAQQAALWGEKLRYRIRFRQPHPMAAGGHGAGAGFRELSFDMCQRPAILASMAAARFKQETGLDWPTEGAGKDKLRVFETPMQRDICDRDLMLAGQFRVSSHAIDQFITAWPGLAGGSFAEVGGLASALGLRAAIAKSPDGAGSDDHEFQVAPQLLVNGNFLLPVVFAFLGAAAYVVLDFYTKLRTSLLTPHDQLLGPVRLLLGMVVGACIGLFYSASGPALNRPADDLIGALSLTASGVAFLAGFGVEGVFDFLRELVGRVFPNHQTVK